MALLIINPSATSTNSGTLTVIQRALGSVIDLEVVHTSRRGEGADLARSTKHEVVIVYGGDGTVNDVATGLVDFETGKARGPKLAVIPGGSTNVFARAIGMSADPVQATAQLLTELEGTRASEVSVGGLRLEGQAERTFLFAAGLGVDGRTVELVERMRRTYSDQPRKISPVRYSLASLAAIAQYIVADNKLTIAADEQLVKAAMAIATTNPTWTYLGSRPLQLTPAASFDSGLGLFTLDALSPARALEVITSLARSGRASGAGVGQYSDLAKIEIRAERALPVQADGESLPESRTLSLRSLPGALRVLTPA